MAKHGAEDLAKIMKDWQGLENETISLAEKLHSKSDNPFIKVIMEMIKRDSQKHVSMQQFVIDHLTKQATRLTADDLIPLGDILDKHIAAEAKSMGLANAAITKTHDFLSNFIVSYLMGDEIKHHEMLTKLDHIKGGLYAYGQAREDRLGGARP